MTLNLQASDQIDPKRTALLLVDFQQFYINDRSDKPLRRLGAFVDEAIALGVKIYWIGDMIGPAFDRARDMQSMQTWLDMNAVQPDHRIVMGSSAHHGKVIGKIESDAFSNPLLLEDLRWEGIKTTLGCGYVAGQCVGVTLQSARRLGFKIGLITTLSADNRKDGRFCSLSKWWIDRHEVPTLTARQVLRGMRPTISPPIP